MTRDEILDDVRRRMDYYLTALETAKIPGSVIAAVHCDSNGARKILINVEEAWSLRP